MPHTYTTFSIGNTSQNRPITVHLFTSTTKPLFRVLYDAGIHGNEPETAEGALLLIDDIKTNNPTFYDNVTIAVIPKLNADGLINTTYENAQGWQLQTDSLIRAGVESQAFYKFANQFKPNVYVNGHNLDAWARGAGTWLFDRHLNYAADAVLLRNDSIAARHDTTWKQYDEIIAHLNATYPPYKFDRFWEFNNDGEISYYVPDICLYHHFIANRYNAVTFLLETVSPFEVWNPQEREELAIQSAFRSFKGIIGYLKQHPQIVGSPDRICPYPVGTELPVRWAKIYEKMPYYTRNVVNDDDGTPDGLLVSKTYRYLYEPTNFVTMPLGYSYPNTDQFESLSYYLFHEEGNFFNGRIGTSTESYEIETVHVQSFTDGFIFNDRASYGFNICPSDVVTSNVESTKTNLSNNIIIYCDQEGGNILPYLLEPQSQYGYTRYPAFVNLALQQDTDYPVIRLMKRLA